MDIDVRKAVRTIEYSDFNGLSEEEVVRFIALAANSYFQLKNLNVGDRVKYDGCNTFLYGKIIALPEIVFTKETDFRDPRIEWGKLKIKWEYKVNEGSVSRYDCDKFVEDFNSVDPFSSKLIKVDWTLESIF